MNTLVSRSSATLARAGGAALAGATGALAAVRKAAKPLHPRGDVVIGMLHRTGVSAAWATPSGVPWLDEAGDDEVLVRVSRSLGLPGPLPDVYGLAVRVPVEGGHGDLLFATTGLGRVTRFVLTPTRSRRGRPLTTLLPYRGPRGPIVLAAEPVADEVYELHWAPGQGEWRQFGRLALTSGSGPDPAVSFDPVQSTIPGLENYGWVRRLREPAYGKARETSGR